MTEPQHVTKVDALRIGIIFKTKTGRAPRRRDFRPGDKEQWETVLGRSLPSADTCARLFGSWSEYVSALGYEPKKKLSNELIEQASLAQVKLVYPGFVEIAANTNLYDGELDGQRVEVKGSTLSARKDNPNGQYFSFAVHNRELDKVCDRLICVGLGWDDERQEHVPLVILDFPKSALGLVSGKGSVMVYANSIFFGGHSRYKPFVTWRAALTPRQLLALVRSE